MTLLNDIIDLLKILSFLAGKLGKNNN